MPQSCPTTAGFRGPALKEDWQESRKERVSTDLPVVVVLVCVSIERRSQCRDHEALDDGIKRAQRKKK